MKKTVDKFNFYNNTNNYKNILINFCSKYVFENCLVIVNFFKNTNWKGYLQKKATVSIYQTLVAKV